MDKETIARNFSRYANSYDRHADVQRYAADELLRQIKGDGFKKILELGCGTGNYTGLLRNRFIDAKIIAVDISREMVRVAEEKLKGKNIEFLIRDAEKLDFKDKFDLISSNAAFQWFEELENCLLTYKGMLEEGGVISFSSFGPQTFVELNTVLKSVLGNKAIVVDGFMDKEELETILRQNFKSAKVKEIRYKDDFATLKDLLQKIKCTGTRGNGLNAKVYFNRKILEDLEKAYLKKFNKIIATCQVIFCTARC